MNKLTGGSFLGSLKNAMHWVAFKNYSDEKLGSSTY
jgi:hypothetical protein